LSRFDNALWEPTVASGTPVSTAGEEIAVTKADRVLRATVWNEYVQEREDPSIGELYPNGVHATIADGLRELLGERVAVATATLGQPRHGLPFELLDRTDVLLWWGHRAHEAVDDAVVEDVCRRVHDGMGLVALHSAVHSKVFRCLMGTTCRLDWRHDDREVLWTVEPDHPIARGVPNPVVIPRSEMYGEPFDIPPPDELVFISSFEGGEVFRSGCCFRRGRGRVFYFAPGDEEYPIYYQPEIRRVLANAVEWADRRPDPIRPAGSIERPRGWYQDGAEVR
jgi:trehalose utilization protein